VDRLERRLRNLGQRKVAFLNTPPSPDQLNDEEQVYVLSPNQNLRLYIKKGTKLYYNEFISIDEAKTNNWEDLT
tara:strand:+ start:1564 stop:1785 length:222 start_codon:yes stop_codon:yes gene_type:complete